MRNQAEYMKDYRRRNPEVLKKQKRREVARRTALRMLSERYPEEFEQILSTVERQMVLKEANGEHGRGSAGSLQQRNGQGNGTGPVARPS